MSLKYSMLFIPLVAVVASGCNREPPTDFNTNVKPIMDKYCAECHMPGSEGAAASGFLVDSYADVMKGTNFGPVVVPGSAESSTLYRLVAGKADPSIKMPHGDRTLTDEEIETIRLWIDQGAEQGGVAGPG
jgi:mono/diheme cytochrome c family protein